MLAAPANDTRRRCRLLLLRQNHFHHFALRPPLLAAHGVRVPPMWQLRTAKAHR